MDLYVEVQLGGLTCQDLAFRDPTTNFEARVCLIIIVIDSGSSSALFYSCSDNNFETPSTSPTFHTSFTSLVWLFAIGFFHQKQSDWLKFRIRGF